MREQEKLRKWNRFFSRQLKKGVSWHEIRLALVVNHSIKPALVELLIQNYRRDQARRTKAATGFLVAFVLMVLMLPFFFQRISITGMPIAEITGTAYYVDSVAGLDSNDGLSEDAPFKTIAKVNTLSLNPGDGVVFKRGSSWRCPSDAYLTIRSGSSSGNVTYGAYGSGAKPLFLGSVEANDESDWTNGGSGNIWTTTFTISREVGHVVFDDELSWGFKRSGSGSLSTQGDFYYDSGSSKVMLYSTDNPASYYLDIELATEYNLISCNSKNNIVIRDLDLRYGARMGIETNDCSYIYILNNSFRHIGGAYQSGTLRYGNAIQLWKNAYNHVMDYNDISQIFDTAITPQYTGSSTGNNFINISMRHNIIRDVRYCFEFFNSNTSAFTQNIAFDQNTCFNIGGTWSLAQRSSAYDFGFAGYATRGALYNLSVRNNIFAYTEYAILLLNPTFPDQSPNLTLDYNLYYDDAAAGYFADWDNADYNYNQFNTFKTNENQDAHSVQSDPLFVDAANGDFRPSAGSPACTMSSTGSYVGALPCESGEPPACGDDSCNGDEDCSSCEADCGVCPPPPNNAPTHSTPLLNASDRPYNTTDAALSCYNQSTADADGDPVTNSYRWFRNNTLVAGLTASTVNDGNTSSGDSWKCEVTPYDGEDYGTARNSSALTINQLPDTVLVRMNASSGNNYTDDELRCYANVTGFMTSMIAYYNIYNGSALYASGSRSVTRNILSSIVNVSSSATNDNESWKCSVKASYDGIINESDWNNASISIQPTPPAPFCGDSVCNGAEDCSSCSSDCGACPPEPFCGDSTCDANETCSSCSSDCGVCPMTGCTLSEKAWDEDSSLPDAFNLSSCFNDPLGHALSFRARGNSSIDVSISANGMVSLSSPANWSGVEHVIFNASDGNRSAVTNNVTLTVSPLPDCGDSVCEYGESCTSCSSDCGACPASGGGGGGGGGASQGNSTDWTCGDWSECLNGKQSQICTHVSRDAQKTNTRSCSKTTGSGTSGVVAPKPKQSDVNKSDAVSVEKKTGVDEENLSGENTTKEPSEQTPGIIVKETEYGPKYALAAGVVALLLLGAFIYGNMKRPRKPAEKAQPQKDYAKELDEYVKTAAKSGYAKNKVKSELLGVGWADDIVDAVVNMNDAEFMAEECEESEEDGENDSKSINFLKGEPGGELQ